MCSVLSPGTACRTSFDELEKNDRDSQALGTVREDEQFDGEATKVV